MNSERLKEFRQAAYELLVLAKDATFELMDAVMTTRNASCLAEFALSPLFNRQWSSVYEALQDSKPDRKKLMILYLKQLKQFVSATEHILVATLPYCLGKTRCQNVKRQNTSVPSWSNSWTRVQHNSLDTRITGQLGLAIATRTD